MIKHTVGPWAARFEEALTIRDGKDNQLAICTHINTKTGGRRNINEVESNARLIAAAPEMLEALRQLYANGYLISYRDDTEEDRQIKSMARAAIEKAMGSA